jgi:hypothetical protein
MIDGIWQKDDLWTFTVRSMDDEDLFLYLAAFSRSESEEWVQQLRTSAVSFTYIHKDSYRLRIDHQEMDRQEKLQRL